MNRRTAFLIGLLLQLVAVFGLFVPYAIRVQAGTQITLRTMPVDPYSIFRGNFVTLAYEAGANAVPSGDPVTETAVYAVLERRGDIYERVSFSERTPDLKEGQVCLAGILEPWSDTIRFPDISQYFVEDGFGREIEQSQTAHRLLADVSVDGSCRAVLTGLRVGPELTQEEWRQWNNRFAVPPMPAPEDRPVPPGQ